MTLVLNLPRVRGHGGSLENGSTSVTSVVLSRADYTTKTESDAFYEHRLRDQDALQAARMTSDQHTINTYVTISACLNALTH